MSKSTSHKLFCDVLEEVKKLPLSTIIGKYTNVHQNRFADHDALCLFHGDKVFGNFKINDKKGIYKCFTCGAYGDGVQFVREYFELGDGAVGFKKAVMKIGVDQGIINEEQASAYFGGTVREIFINEVKEDQMKAKEKKNGVTEIASPMIRDIAFQLFLRGTSLTDEHRTYLRNRGLSDEEIDEKGFFTFPEPTKEFLDGMNERVKRHRYSPNIFKEVPGFHTMPSMEMEARRENGQKEHAYSFIKYKGIGIPVKDAAGNYIGIQIRKDNPGVKAKRYTWFSSSYAAYDDNDYIFGTPAGAPTHVAYPKENRFPGVVFITEGFFKAEEVAKTFGAVCISMSGVGNYRTVNEDLKSVQAHTGQQITHIYVSYDADMSQNLQVYHHAKNMVEMIREEFEAEMFISLWDEKDGKGIDDLIQNHKVSTLRKADFDAFSKLYDEVIEKLVKQYEKIQKIPKEVVEKEYFETVFPKVYKVS